MRRTLLSILALLLTIAAEAQTLKITTSSNTYSFSATEMTETSASYKATTTRFTICGFTLSCFKVFLMALDAAPAFTKSASYTWYSRCMGFCFGLTWVRKWAACPP